MKHLTKLATAATAAALLALLGACNDEDSDSTSSDPSPTETTTATAEPTPSPSEPTASLPQQAGDLVGTWRDDAVDWTVHFAEDGTFTVDYEGNVDFLTGTYTLDGATVTLAGLDGNDQVGEVTEAGLVFTLGTLTKR